jgi:tRNA (cytidine/uridine-2'-O-)-methyltransferase
MPSIALFEPEIPPNTGNIARLCAATNSPLHIIGRPMFKMDEKAVKRAGLDYWPHVNVFQHEDYETFTAAMQNARVVLLSTKAKRSYTTWDYQDSDCFVFGPETRGLPESLMVENPDRCLTIPMLNDNVRSLNLANAVSIVLYEALRQLGLLEKKTQPKYF